MDSTLREYNSLRKRNFGVCILPHLSTDCNETRSRVFLLSGEHTVNIHETANPAYGGRDRRTASEAEKPFCLPPTYLV